jgi:DNA-binding NarL/FixJ family response regulator
MRRMNKRERPDHRRSKSVRRLEDENMTTNERNTSRVAPTRVLSRGTRRPPTPPVESPTIEAASIVPAAPVEKAAIVVIDQRALTRDCLVNCLKAKRSDYVVLAFATVAQWQEVASTHPPAAVIVLCTPGRKNADLQIERDLSFVSHDGTGVPVVIVSDAEDADHVIAALEHGARGYIPTSVTLDVAVEAMHFVEAGGTFVPASSLTSSRRAADAGAEHKGQLCGLFTARQAAVLEAVRQGKANKRIAYELNMREGTVKVHVRNIMKKLKARNRTEVAVLASALLADGEED